MKYNAKNGIIECSVEELVDIARRGIARTAPTDKEEPDIHGIGQRAEEFLEKDIRPLDIALEETIGEHRFRFFGRADGVKEREIFLVKEWDTLSKSPKREDIAKARGEGFILSYMLAKNSGLDSGMLTIVYINRKTGGRVTTKEEISQKKLTAFFEKCTLAVSKSAMPEIERVTIRLPSMREARFPFGHRREGQSEFISTVYRAISRGSTLFAEAPTGTGKTVSVIYPAVRAIGDEKCDKVFYFTPKSTTANAAKECIEIMCKLGVKIKAVLLGAKERICRRGVLCNEGKDLCPATKKNRIADAALALYKENVSVVSEVELLRVAESFNVCPHELSLTYSELCDIIICDINYLFDRRVYIKRYFLHGGHYSFLIDEAHNLPDRAREMYSAEISDEQIASVCSSEIIGEFSPLIPLARAAREEVHNLLFPYLKDEVRVDKDGVKRAATHLSEPPTRLYSIFSELLETSESELLCALRAVDEEKNARIKLLRAYLASVRQVYDVLEAFDDGYEMFIFLNSDNISFKLFCIDTSGPISRCLAKGRSAVFFSATLTPISYYKSVLGTDRGALTLEIGSPFDPSQLSVTIMDKISTRFSERDDTLGAVCRVIAATVSAKRGHYIIFSPSFDYSEALARSFALKYPKIKILEQKRDMNAREKQKLLEELGKNDGTYLIAFCVMGGIYSEGIDLAGDSLIGAVIVGIGIPSLSYEREAIAAYYDEKCDEGKQYAYIYPGMNRVFQAAGRVIRRESDKGVVVLIDDRFADPIYKKSIPSFWADLQFADDAKALRGRLDEFWNQK